MKGWQIFEHSVRLVFRNIDAALQISAVLYAIYAVAQVYLMRAQARINAQLQSLEEGSFDPNAALGAGAGLFYFVASVGTLVLGLWIAISWHRYVLREERPAGWVPAWHGGALLSYLGRSVMVGILAMFAALAAMGLMAMLLPGILSLLAVFSGVAAAAYVFFRLCPMLPAAALGERMTLKEAWGATQGAGEAIFVLVLLTVAASAILQVPTLVGGGGAGIIDILYTLAVGWVMMLVGSSVLTTFYGHYIEGRPLG